MTKPSPFAGGCFASLSSTTGGVYYQYCFFPTFSTKKTPLLQVTASLRSAVLRGAYIINIVFSPLFRLKKTPLLQVAASLRSAVLRGAYIINMFFSPLFGCKDRKKKSKKNVFVRKFLLSLRKISQRKISQNEKSFQIWHFGG